MMCPASLLPPPLLLGPTNSTPTPAAGSSTRVGVLLAAGRGSRFDPMHVGAKLLATIEGDAIALQAARRLQSALGRVLVVIRPEWRDDPMLQALATSMAAQGLEVSVCAEAQLGMGHSLAWGIRQAVLRFERPSTITVALADMPRIASSTFERLHASPLTAQSIVAPRFDGRRGHPVVFGSAHFEALMALCGDQGAGILLKRCPVDLIDVDDPGVLADVDTRADLQSLGGLADDGTSERAK